MEQLDDVLARLEGRHQAALAWFRDRAGKRGTLAGSAAGWDVLGHQGQGHL